MAKIELDSSDVTPRGKLGKAGSHEHDKFVRDACERIEYYYDQTRPIFARTLDYWDLYLNYRPDFRGPGEEWRSNIGVPLPFSNVETKVASVVSLLTSADPIIQAEAVDDSFQESARSIERLLDYTFRNNQTYKTLTKLLRSRSVQGTVFYKVIWEERAHQINVSRSETAVHRYQEYLGSLLAEQPGLPKPPDWMLDPKAFEIWRKLVNDSLRARVPAPPLDGPQRIVQFRGPVLKELPFYSVYLDPLIDEMQYQPFVAHRAAKTRAWLKQQVDAGIYDGAAVEYALDGWDGDILVQEEESLALKLGIANQGLGDPYYRHGVLLQEVYQPGTEIPYAIILNEKAVINKNPYEMPTWDGEVGINGLRALVVPGHYHGQSELAESKSLFEEMNKIRNLRLDGATLNTLPVFTRLREVGIPELMHKFVPGGLIPVSRHDAIQPLRKDPMPSEAWREPQEIKMEVEDAMGIYTSTKGAPAQIGRVTGTEFQGRANQAQLRIKLDAMFTEEELSPSVRKIVALWAQMGEERLRVRVGGQPDPFIQVAREELLEALNVDWRFRGATKAINKDMAVQQLLLFVDKFGQSLKPTELRYLAKLVLDTLDLRGSSQIISEKGTNEAQEDYTLQRQVQQTQLQMQQMQMQQQQMMMQQPQAAPAQPSAQGGQPPAQQPPQPQGGGQ